MEKLLIPLVSSLEFPTLWRVGNDGKLELTDQVIVLPAKIAGLFIGFFVLRWFLHRAIHKIGRRTGNGNGHVAGLLAKSKRGSQFVESTLQNERRAQRAETVASLLCSVVTIVLSAVLLVMLLNELGFNVLPLVASASIIGVVLGFGAQTLVKDFLAGIFMIFEDQYGVGDLIDMEKATGVVESVGLRITRLRGDDGTTWYVRNGEVLRVGNLSTRSPDQVAAAETNAEAAASARESAANAPAPYEAPAEGH
ncbi:mechanosensitive ion channel family protein [Kribbella sp. NBC_01245]|uniref:mechanosensitive ion channel family protein n=1 Tax=Kribbella sp. NBC_01245 TaxID=2903578 RepID=UPI002E2C8E3F|nr:mechanosensitive ion channel domain-containing protein [Kribbella sp. NBC_01245]